MKIVSPKEMARIESLAYSDGCLEADFMEAAGLGVALHAEAFIERHGLDRQVFLLCGHGNNGGDAFVAGRRLLEAGIYVTAILARNLESCKPLCRSNYQKFLQAGGEVSFYDPDVAVTFPSRGIVIDGLFGIGFYGIARDPYSAIIRSANVSGLPVLSIDVPSGLDADTGMAEGPVICATETIYLGLPKIGYFLAEGWNHVGRLHYVDFGLPERYVEQAESSLWLPLPEQLHSLLPTIQRDRHKYQAGMVVGLAGSPGMPGAAILSSMAVLRAGAGMVKLCHPDGMQIEIAGCPPEVIRAPYSVQNVKGVVDSLNSANATFVGPGMGRSPVAQVLLELALPQIENPCVIDADALYLLSHNEVELPKKSVLTPHRGEMAKLLHLQGHPELTLDFLKQCQRYVEQHNVTLVLKGGPGFILHPKTPIFVNIYGDPGMATAGSGDVLTGIIAAMLAQGLSTHAAALIGVYLHSRAGEAAAEKLTSYCCIASDIIKELPSAYKQARNWNRDNRVAHCSD